jgi:hypothetical protein
MKIAYEDIYDIISTLRIRALEDDLSPEDVLDEIEGELQTREIEEF